MENKEATESARITANRLVDFQALSLTSMALDAFTVVFFVVNNWKDHELRTAVNLGLIAVSLVLVWKTIEIGIQKRAISKKNYQEVAAEINQRLEDDVLRSEINQWLK